MLLACLTHPSRLGHPWMVHFLPCLQLPRLLTPSHARAQSCASACLRSFWQPSLQHHPWGRRAEHRHRLAVSGPLETSAAGWYPHRCLQPQAPAAILRGRERAACPLFAPQLECQLPVSAALCSLDSCSLPIDFRRQLSVMQSRNGQAGGCGRDWCHQCQHHFLRLCPWLSPAAGFASAYGVPRAGHHCLTGRAQPLGALACSPRRPIRRAHPSLRLLCPEPGLPSAPSQAHVVTWIEGSQPLGMP